MSDLLELIKTRKSVRTYLDKQIPDEDLRKILEAGRLAPSWMNVQSWKFILIKSQENKDLLSELSLGQPHVKNAAALIVCVADMNAWEEAKITHIKNPTLNPTLQKKMPELNNIQFIYDPTGTFSVASDFTIVLAEK